MSEYMTSWLTMIQLLLRGRSFSGRERNCVFLNCANPGDEHPEAGITPFANMSAVSGLDFAEDGRGMAVVDWDHDGDLDMWLRNRTEPRLRLMINGTRDEGLQQDASFVAFRLRGTSCNRDGIGARVEVASADGSKSIQTLYAGDGFVSQSSKWLHFGLGTSTAIQGVVVRWPGGEPETFAGVEPGRRYVLEQGSGQARPTPISKRTLALKPSTQPRYPGTNAAQVFLPVRFPMPRLRFTSFDDTTPRTIEPGSRPRLINLWASWCLPCAAELKELGKHEQALRRAGLDVLALSVDGLDENAETGPDDARRMIARLKFPFESGRATDELLAKVDVLQEVIFKRIAPMTVPTSLLLDRDGHLAVIFRGPVGVDTLLRAVEKLDVGADEMVDLSLPFSGRQYTYIPGLDLGLAAKAFKPHWPEDAARFARLAKEMAKQKQVE